MSSLSPDQYDGRAGMSQASQSPDASGSDHSKGLLNLGGIFKRSAKAEGAQPKKRGPKPDSKPALTRRQELNRQAQRTHRERKELYVKALEEEVLRLKEAYSTISQDKTKLADENKQLKELLAQYGVPFPGNMGPDDGGDGSGQGNGQFGGNSSGYSQGGGSYGVFSPGGASQSSAPSMTSSGAPYQQHPSGQHLQELTNQASISKGVDYSQLGVDFVLSLERPCMDHLPFLVNRASGDAEEFHGHALMASCPPKPFDKIPEDSPFGTMNIQDDTDSGQKTWDMSKADLSTLIDLSARIDLDGEVTPVMAWAMIMSHPRFMEMSMSDLEALKAGIGHKIRCYGFGAVTEQFEVQDVIEGVMSNRAPIMAC